MMTADQIRIQLQACYPQIGESVAGQLVSLLVLLEDVLPKLIEENAKLRRDLRLSEASRGLPYPMGE